MVEEVCYGIRKRRIDMDVSTSNQPEVCALYLLIISRPSPLSLDLVPG